MKATFVELRTKPIKIIRALDRNEPVTIFYRGHPKAVMYPFAEGRASAGQAKDHAAFGLWKDRDDWQDVPAAVRALRRGRFDAL